MKPIDLIRFASKFASAAHMDAGHTYDGRPYDVHLAEVCEVLMRFGEYSKVMHASAYLHDVVEDVGVKLSTIEDLFGEDVAKLVGAVTDEPGPNRKARKALTYPKIRATPGAVQLKLADRIANIENGIARKDKRFFLMYKREHQEFEMKLRDFCGEDEVVRAMWGHLNHLFAVGEEKL